MIDIGLFAEDDGHRSLLVPLVYRLAELETVEVDIHVRNAQGGHGPAVSSLRQFIRDQRKGVEPFYEILIPAIDANCIGTAARTKEIEKAIGSDYAGFVVPATPEPHIELWYIADPTVVGRILDSDTIADVPAVKCERKRYKTALRQAFRDAGVETLADGIEYGPDIAGYMDLEVAGRSVDGFGEFVGEMRRTLRQFSGNERRR